MTYKIKAGRYLHFCPSYNVSVNAAYTECVSDMFHICRDYSNVCSKPSTHKTKLKEKLNMKNNATNSPVLTLVYGAAIAAIYVVLTMVFLPISFGPIQFRISELLCVLPYFTPAAIPGLFIGCLLANFLGGAAALDVIFGSIATLIGAVGSYLLRKNRYLVSVPPILANMIIVPWVLRFAYGSEDMIWFSTITVGIGEILAIGLLGQILLSVLIRYQHVIFGKAAA